MQAIVPNVTDEESKFVADSARSFNALKLQLYEQFPERRFLIKQMLISLYTGQHLLIYGEFGTAKSKIASTFLRSIQGKGMDGIEVPRLFEFQFDSETTADKIIGFPDIKRYNETGKYYVDFDGFLPTAHFALLDELFDCPSVLRAVNDILNERRLRDGQLSRDVPLMTAIATTNRSPKDIAELYPMLQLAAVNDRFLCIARVKPLSSSEGRDQMVANYLMNNNHESGLDVTARVNFADVQRLVKIVREKNLFPDYNYMQIFRQAIEAYQKGAAQIGRTVSDRRMNWLTQTVVAQAMLSGRTNLLYEDLAAAVYGLAESDDNDQAYSIFNATAVPIIEKAKAIDQANFDSDSKMRLDDLEKRLLQIKEAAKSLSDAGVGNALRSVNEIDGAIRGVVPQTARNRERQTQLLGEVSRVRNAIITRR